MRHDHLFHNYQDDRDPNNGRAISSAGDLAALLDRMRGGHPIMAEFTGPGDFEIVIGIGGELGCIQCSRMDGNPPYLMAVSHNPPMKRGEFQCGGTPTPVRSTNILTFDEMKSVVLHFFDTGERSDRVNWRPVRPGDVKEDAERRLDS